MHGTNMKMDYPVFSLVMSSP